MKALAKPSVAAWTVNQLARRRGARMKELLKAADGLRKAQERALAGKGGDALRDARQRERELVTELRREARTLLAESDRPATDAVLERVASTLSNAAVDPDARELLEAGRLTEEVDSSGFDAFAGMALSPTSAKRPAAKPEPAPRPAKSDAAAKRRAAARLRANARDLEREAHAAERDAERAAGVAERAARAADEAAADAEEAAEAARAARAAADQARAEADAAG